MYKMEIITDKGKHIISPYIAPHYKIEKEINKTGISMVKTLKIQSFNIKGE